MRNSLPPIIPLGHGASGERSLQKRNFGRQEMTRQMRNLILFFLTS